MKNVNVLLGIVSLLSIGCGWTRGSGDYQVYVDPNFDPQHQAIVRDALAIWSDCVEGTITFTETRDWRQEDDFILISPSTIQELSLEYNEDSDMLGVCQLRGDQELIEVAINQSLDSFHQTTLHELGHAIGLPHMDPGTLMYHNQMSAAYAPTESDLERVCSIWGCNASKLKCSRKEDRKLLDVVWD